MECSEEELIALGLGIASGKIEEKDIGIWIVKHNRGELNEQLQDDEFREQWEKNQPEMDLIRADLYTSLLQNIDARE